MWHTTQTTWHATLKMTWPEGAKRWWRIGHPQKSSCLICRAARACTVKTQIISAGQSMSGFSDLKALTSVCTLHNLLKSDAVRQEPYSFCKHCQRKSPEQTSRNPVIQKPHLQDDCLLHAFLMFLFKPLEHQKQEHDCGCGFAASLAGLCTGNVTGNGQSASLTGARVGVRALTFAACEAMQFPLNVQNSRLKQI